MSTRQRRLTFFFIGVFIVYGCSRRPPEDVVVDLVKDYVKQNVNYYCGFMQKMEDVDFQVIQIIEYGKYNKDKSYWPIKIKLKGSAICIEYTLGGDVYSKKRKHWDETLNWRVKLYEDDYGNKTWRRYGW